MSLAGANKTGFSVGRITSLTTAVVDALRVHDFGWPFWAAVIAMPFVCSIEFALIALLAIQFACILRCRATAGERFLLCFLLAFAYSGITVLGFRLYDWALLVALAYFLIARRVQLETATLSKALVGICVVLALLAANYSAEALLQAMRFSLSLVCCVLFASVDVGKKRVARCVMAPVAVALYCAVVMLARYGLMMNIEGVVASTNFFIYEDEVRAAGFFSDPNKFMSFLLFMLFIVDWAKGTRGVHVEHVPIFVGLFLTGSRTALICVALYFAYKAFRSLTRNGLQAAVLLLAVSSAAFLVVLLLSNGNLGDIADGVWNRAAELFGRERTLTISSDISEDGRVLVWQQAFGFISERSFFGWGLDAYETLLPYPTHNTFLNLLLSGGVVYILAFILNIYPVATKGDPFLFIALVFVPVFLLDLLDYRLLFCLVGLVQFKDMRAEDEDALSESGA